MPGLGSQTKLPLSAIINAPKKHREMKWDEYEHVQDVQVWICEVHFNYCTFLHFPQLVQDAIPKVLRSDPKLDVVPSFRVDSEKTRCCVAARVCFLNQGFRTVNLHVHIELEETNIELEWYIVAFALQRKKQISTKIISINKVSTLEDAGRWLVHSSVFCEDDQEMVR